MNLALFFGDGQLVKAAKRLFEHGAGVKVLDLLGAAGAVLQLLRRVALNDQQAAGFERTRNPTKMSVAKIRSSVSGTM